MIVDQLVGFVLFASFFIGLTQSRRHDWMIHLDERRNAECFLSTDRYFCHFSEENGHLERDVKGSSCQIGGVPLSFIMLKNKNIRSEQLIDWLVPFHLIEQYVDYLNSTNSTSTDDTLICNCTHQRIGIDCEYEIENKAWDLIRLLEAQRGKPSNEYETLTSLIDGISCNGNVPRVEWREICDGISQCEDASDEFNCHLLELNQCEEEEDEYRCRNGMCIPKEFAFDGTHDCMDSSDEQELRSLVRLFDPCAMQTIYRCDERLCRKDQFSCGDGQCVHWSTLINRKDGCRNSRHLAYRCETDGTLLSIQKDLTGICQETTELLEELTNTSSCFVSLRHFLTTDREEILQMSMENLLKNCSERIEYPLKTMLSPVLAMFYNRNQLEVFYKNENSAIRKMSRRAHLYCLKGKMICDGQMMTMRGEYCMTNDEFEGMTSKYSFLPFSHLFCQIVTNQMFISQ